MFLGIRCEKTSNDNYNLRFTGVSIDTTKKQQIKSRVNNYQFKNTVTLCAWVKYDNNAAKGTPFAILSYSDDNQNWVPIFWMSNQGVTAPGNQLIGYDLTPNQWYQVGVCIIKNNYSRF